MSAEPYRPRREPLLRSLRLRGLEHALTEWPGREGAEPLILLHGFADAGATFQFLVDELDPGHRCLALDWRGFGRSQWPEDGYWFPDYYADLEAFLDAVLPGRPATLIGHSMGGNIALSYAGLRPGRVARVVALEGFGLPRTDAGQAPERLAHWLDQVKEGQAVAEFPSFDAFATLLARRNPRLGAARAAFVARCWGSADAAGCVRARFDPRHKRVNPVLYRREEAEATWRRVLAPVLYVLGAQSEFLARIGDDAAPARMAGLIEGLRSCIVADAGHMLHHEQPQAVAAAIEEFLRK
jgi:pimeloyl-ACP methyl ester carboxylesterase